jgi:3-oxoacyl-[acyl-carrier-protein] synthase II
MFQKRITPNMHSTSTRPPNPQPQRGAFETLPSRVIAAVPRHQLAAWPHYDCNDSRRNAPFMEFALCAAAEASTAVSEWVHGSWKCRANTFGAGIIDMPSSGRMRKGLKPRRLAAPPQGVGQKGLASLSSPPCITHHSQALADAGWAPSTPEQRAATGVCIGAGIGSTTDTADAATLIAAGRLRRVSPYFVPRILPNMAAGAVSIRHSLQGPNLAPSTACATGVHAVGDAFRAVQRGDADVMVGWRLKCFSCLHTWEWMRAWRHMGGCCSER